MRVTRRTGDTLVIEEGTGTKLLLGGGSLAIGAFGAVMWWVKGELLFLIVGAIFVFYGAKVLLFHRTQTHRFERWRGKLAIDAKGLWGTRRRELPLDSIADIVIEEIRTPRTISYYLYHVTKDGQRIRWAETYDGSKENALECLRQVREFLGMPAAPTEIERTFDR